MNTFHKHNSPTQRKISHAHISTLGCSKNVYDSELLMGQLKVNGIEIVESPEMANAIIINTCGFITPAKEESIQAILEAGEMRKMNEDLTVIVCGCLSTRYQKDLRKKIPQVDAYFGTEDYRNILQFLNLTPKQPEYLYEDRLLSTPSHYAYLKISEGCNHKCAFCAIPLMRGKHRSRIMGDIVREAQLLAEKGVKELILIAQDTTFYGLDLYKKQRILDLLAELEKIEKLEWIRLHYAYPTTFQDELVELMVNSSKIVNYVDLPIQHISENMLTVMKRGGTSTRIKKILNRLRERIPDVAIRTTLIVGHPGETEADFRELLEFIEEFKFERMGAFIYSPEENTAAFKHHPPDVETANERYSRLLNLQQTISAEKNRRLLGEVSRVLIDEYEAKEQVARGRTYADSPEIDNEVIIEDPKKDLIPGSFYSVRITDTAEYEIFGKIVEE
jgi:ribosomal protein S12 methylthiotransferase